MSSIAPNMSDLIHKMNNTLDIDDVSLLTPTCSPCKTQASSPICPPSPVKEASLHLDRHKRCSKHNKEIRYCKECGGHSLCEHKRHKSKCRICSVKVLESGELQVKGSFCEHMVRKGYCKRCNGNQICRHNKQKYSCKTCCGSQVCSHGNQRSFCKRCNGSQICSHGKVRRSCISCRRTDRLRVENLISIEDIDIGKSNFSLADLQSVTRQLKF